MTSTIAAVTGVNHHHEENDLLQSNENSKIQNTNGYGSFIKIRQASDDEEYTKLTTTTSGTNHHHYENDNHYTNDDVDGTATSFSVILGMTKGLIGCGALSLSNGIALYTDTSQLGYVMGYSTFWIIIMGMIFGYYCYFLGGRLSLLTGYQYTYRSIWEHAVGGQHPYTSFLVSATASSKAFLATIAYASILTDTTMTLLQSLVLISSTDHPMLLYLVSLSRTEILLLITIITLTPLCFIKNVQLLAPFSAIGTVGVIFTTIIMFIRYYDGTYRMNGIYYQDLIQHTPQYVPQFTNTKYNALTTDILPYVCMVYESFVMHYNAPRFYRELKNRTLRKYSIICCISFGASGIIYIGIACFGYMTFGNNSSSFILNNYSPYDPLAILCRIAVGISTLTAYPLVFMGVRDGILDMYNIPIQQQTNQQLNIITIVLLIVVTIISIFIHDLGLINAVGGGVVATAIVFVFPTFMFLMIIRQHKNIYDISIQHISSYFEITSISLIAIIGIIFGIVGAYTAVQLAKAKAEAGAITMTSVAVAQNDGVIDVVTNSTS